MVYLQETKQEMLFELVQMMQDGEDSKLHLRALVLEMLDSNNLDTVQLNQIFIRLFYLGDLGFIGEQIERLPFDKDFDTLGKLL